MSAIASIDVDYMLLVAKPAQAFTPQPQQPTRSNISTTGIAEFLWSHIVIIGGRPLTRSGI